MATKDPSPPWRFAAAPHPRVRPVPAFDDNYLWLLCDSAGERAYVVDPGDAAAVEQALEASGLSLAGILLTHHHADHVGGVVELSGRWRCPVYGPADERIEGVTRTVSDADSLELPEVGARVRVIAVPGHTRSHIAYYATSIGDDPRGVLFCGDTLFAAGCGRLFEGSPAQMHASLTRLAELPPDTLVYCAHEYTMSNLRFALAAEPESASIAARLQEAAEMRSRELPTVPSTVGVERATNPFLRTLERTIAHSLAQRAQPVPDDPVARFALLRQWKDVFR